MRRRAEFAPRLRCPGGGPFEGSPPRRFRLHAGGRRHVDPLLELDASAFVTSCVRIDDRERARSLEGFCDERVARNTQLARRTGRLAASDLPGPDGRRTDDPGQVAAVGNAGALGSFGFADTDAATMRHHVEAVRKQGSLPINIHIVVDAPPRDPGAAEVRSALDALRPMREELGVPAPTSVDAPYAPSLDHPIEAALELRPALLGSRLGAFAPDVIERAHATAQPLLPFMLQNKATAPTRAAAARSGAVGDMSLRAGQPCALSRRAKAADLVDRIVDEYDAATQALIRAMRG